MSGKVSSRIYERRHYREVFAMLGAVSTGLVVVAFALAFV